MTSRRYLPEGTPPPQSAAPVLPPRPGHGRVWVNQVHEDLWAASWQDGDRETGVEGTREEVVTWAHAQPAVERVVFVHEKDDYVPLT